MVKEQLKEATVPIAEVKVGEIQFMVEIKLRDIHESYC